MEREKLIIFDCDGTLVDTESIHAESISKKFAQFGLLKYTPAFIEENLIGYGSDMFEQIIKDNISADIKFDRESFFKTMNSEAMSSIRNRVVPIVGIKELLEKIDINLSVASNGLRGAVIESLKYTDLLKFFDEQFIHTAAEVANPKPAPELFLHAAKKRNIDPKNCLVIEDSHVGVMAAIKAGMQVIAFIRDDHKHTKNCQRIKELQPHFIVDHPSQILTYIKDF
jgi:HAD superfamily hydrolase (TIGR01509 family)